MRDDIAKDKEALLSYLRNYSLTQILENEEKIQTLGSMHKKLFGLMTYTAELKKQKGNSLTLFYLSDMNSDLLLGLFNWIQGMDKPARLEMRCSIENFLKAILCCNKPEIIKEKAVHEIFNFAKADASFSSKFTKSKLEQIRNVYVELCKTVHNSISEIDSTSAIDLLPAYNKEQACRSKEFYIKITEAYLGVLYYNNVDVIASMHPKNYKLFMSTIARNAKKNVYSERFS